MNFLSHFYFDRNAADADHVLGCVMPDLIRNARKEWIIHPEKHPDDFQSPPELNSIYTGWLKHLSIDRIFHSSEFFTMHTRQIKDLVAPVLANSPVRPSFLAHIALELMLDSLLITAGIINPDSFYDQLRMASRKTIKQFLTLNHITGQSHFFRFFDNFLQVSYLHSYRETINIMYALNRVCMRVWPQSMNETHKMQLTAVLLDYRKQLEHDFMIIFDEIEERV